MDDLTIAEMGNLKVVEIHKSRVVCETVNGGRVFIPRAHVRVTDGGAEALAELGDEPTP